LSQKMIKEPIDNFLTDVEIEKQVFEFLTGSEFPYYYQPHLAYEGAGLPNEFFFQHRLFDEKPLSNYFDFFDQHIFQKLNYKTLYRAKVNLTTFTPEPVISEWHIDDVNKDHKVAIFYVNDNNGYTEIFDGEKNYNIASKRNRLVKFDCNFEHRSVGHTDEKARVVININYE